MKFISLSSHIKTDGSGEGSSEEIGFSLQKYLFSKGKRVNCGVERGGKITLAC
eukprot:m.3893 g.3893  ORF g.3893 m.3893 type:complete len:53 (-) comp3902_c0_seq1:11-169(-)